MKIKLLLLSVPVFLLLSCSLSFADVPEEVDRIIKEEMAPITDEMKQRRDVWGIDDLSRVPLRPGQPDQLYNLDLSKVKESARDYRKGEIDSMLKADPEWEYPLLDEKGRITAFANIVKRGSSWNYVGIGYLSEPNKKIEFLSSGEDNVIKFLNEQGITGIDAVKYLRAAAFHTDFIYVDTKKGDYLVPLFTSFEMLGLKNKKVYPAAEVLTKIVDELNRPVEQRGGALAGGFGDTQNNQVPTSSIISLVALLLIVLGVVTAMLMRRKPDAGDT